MGSNMSKDETEALEKIAQSAEPYEDEAPEINYFDYGGDFQRMLATLAKKALEGKLDKGTAKP